MKQSAKIITSFLLSVLLISVGSGITLVHCCHSDKLTVVGLADVCKDNCTPMSECMQATVVTLSPVNKSISNAFDFEAPVFSLAPFSLPVLPEFSSVIDTFVESIPFGRFHHPRAYLSFIRILII